MRIFAPSTQDFSHLQAARQRLIDGNGIPFAFKPTVEQRIAESRTRVEEIKLAPTERQAAMRQQRQRREQEIAREAVDRSLAVHLIARNALESRIVWFWTNHFSVLSRKALVRITLESFEFEAIAPRTLGTFQDLLLHASLHPAMLSYLDNTQNRSGKINENLAREILELHTLGVNGGYSQQDVQQLALALTGIGVVGFDGNSDTLCDDPQCVAINGHGAVLRPRQHQGGPKKLLGKTYAREDGLEAVDMLSDLALHPSTARHIARKLCQYWLSDEPESAWIDSVSRRFLQTRGDLLETLSGVLEFQSQPAAREARLKDPFRHMTDIVRALLPTQQGVESFEAQPLRAALGSLGMGHYMRVSPDGYPLDSSAWNNNSTLLLRLQVCNQLLRPLLRPQLAGGGNDAAGMRAGRRGKRGNSGALQARIRTLADTLSPASRAALTGFDDEPADWLALWAMTPEMMFD